MFPTLAGEFLSTAPPESYRESESHRRVRLFATPWTMQSMEFSRPEYSREAQEDWTG